LDTLIGFNSGFLKKCYCEFGISFIWGMGLGLEKNMAFAFALR